MSEFLFKHVFSKTSIQLHNDCSQVSIMSDGKWTRMKNKWWILYFSLLILSKYPLLHIPITYYIMQLPITSLVLTAIFWHNGSAILIWHHTNDSCHWLPTTYLTYVLPFLRNLSYNKKWQFKSRCWTPVNMVINNWFLMFISLLLCCVVVISGHTFYHIE